MDAHSLFLSVHALFSEYLALHIHEFYLSEYFEYFENFIKIFQVFMVLFLC